MDSQKPRRTSAYHLALNHLLLSPLNLIDYRRKPIGEEVANLMADGYRPPGI
jgi:hypothetical protein